MRWSDPDWGAQRGAGGGIARRWRHAALLFFANADINRLAVHTTLHTLAWALSGAFWTVFLLRAGVPATGIFLAVAGILVLRLALRPLVLVSLPRLGARPTLILGTFLTALQYPALALVHGPGPALVLCCIVTAFGSVFYWTCYHAFFAALGDAENRGSQLGARQALVSFGCVIGPAIGGTVLAGFGPWAAFGASTVIEIAATIPLLKCPEPVFLRQAPAGAFTAARAGVVLFFTDGWIVNCSAMAWDIIAFRALATRYDAFGWLLAAAALSGAFGGLIWGRFIDLGHARRAVWVNLLVFSATLLFKALCGGSEILVVAAATTATLLGALYTPSLMTAVYNESKASPCPLRFQFAAEGGWDIGGALACLAAAAIAALGAPAALPLVILMGIPGAALQALLLNARYTAQARAMAFGPAPTP